MSRWLYLETERLLVLNLIKEQLVKIKVRCGFGSLSGYRISFFVAECGFIGKLMNMMKFSWRKEQVKSQGHCSPGDLDTWICVTRPVFKESRRNMMHVYEIWWGRVTHFWHQNEIFCCMISVLSDWYFRSVENTEMASIECYCMLVCNLVY